MSALPPKADMCDAASDVRYGPIADILRTLGPFLPEADICDHGSNF
jgi:hypothetical protein